jgi:hypothetical protein
MSRPYGGGFFVKGGKKMRREKNEVIGLRLNAGVTMPERDTD